MATESSYSNNDTSSSGDNIESIPDFGVENHRIDKTDLRFDGLENDIGEDDQEGNCISVQTNVLKVKKNTTSLNT